MLTKLKRALEAIAQGHPVTVHDGNLIVVENPDFEEGGREDPKLVIDLAELFEGRHRSHFLLFDRILKDEPIFPLYGRDTDAPHRIRDWAYQRRVAVKREERDRDELRRATEAEEIADEFVEWRNVREGVWRIPGPDEGRVHYNNPE